MKNYTFSSYQADVAFVMDSRQVQGTIGKLESMMNGLESDRIHIHHEALRQKLLPMYKVSSMLLSSSEIEKMLRDLKITTSGEKDQLIEEIGKKIREKVDKEYEKRVNRALNRVRKYREKNILVEVVENPVYSKLKELYSALKEENPDKVYDLAERICIMTEDFPDGHPVVVEYRKVLSKAPVSQH